MVYLSCRMLIWLYNNFDTWKDCSSNESGNLAEGRIHGDLLFPLSVYRVEKENDVFFNYHWHEEIEFIYMTEGGTLLLYWLVHDRAISKAKPCLLPSGQLHACYPANEQPAYFHAIVFDPHLLSSSAYDVIQSKYMQPWIEQRLILPGIFRSTSAWEQCVLAMLLRILSKQYERRPRL